MKTKPRKHSHRFLAQMEARRSRKHNTFYFPPKTFRRYVKRYYDQHFALASGKGWRFSKPALESLQMFFEQRLSALFRLTGTVPMLRLQRKVELKAEHVRIMRQIFANFTDYHFSE